MGRRTIWIPDRLEQDLELLARSTGVSFSKIVVAHVIAAVDHTQLARIRLGRVRDG